MQAIRTVKVSVRRRAAARSPEERKGKNFEVQEDRPDAASRPQRQPPYALRSASPSSTTITTMVPHGPLTLLLVPFLGLDHVPPSYDCLFQSYYGTYGSRHGFLIDEACRLSSFSLMELGTAVDMQWEENLVWVERGPVDSSLVSTSFEVDFGGLLSRLAELPPPDPQETTDFQTPMGLVHAAAGFEVVHLEQSGALLSLNDWTLRSIERALPRYWTSSVFPTSPLPLIPVPRPSKERLRKVLPSIRYNHVVAAIVNGISVYHLKKDIQYLTGEDPSSDILSRHSFSEGAIRAAKWLQTRFEESGANCTLEHFQEGFAPNVIWCVSLPPGPVPMTDMFNFA